MGGILGGKTIRTSDTKIANFQVNSATYGEVAPVIFGTTRISGNIIDYFDFTAIAHTTSQKTGKGGGSRTENTSYTYTAAVVIGLCEGPVNGIARIWKDKEIYVTPEAFNYANDHQHDEANTGKQNFLQSILGNQTYGLTLFKGELGQTPWAYTQSKHPEKALPYSGLAYMAGVVDLGDSAGLPNLNFEVSALLTATGDGLDANPADCINYIILDTLNGTGFGTGGIDSAGLDRLRTFAKASDLLISTPPGDTKKAYEIINDINNATNCMGFWSQNRLKLVPRCDERLERNGVIFEPNLTPEYDLDEDDFLPMEDGRLVIWKRTDGTQAFNQATIEFVNRANSYEVETVSESILVDVNRRGLRPADTETIHYLHSKERAQYVASMKAMKSIYGRNEYTFRLDYSKNLLENGDLVTLTERSSGLVKKPVIIESAKEIDIGEWEYTASGKPPGIYSPGRYSVNEADRPVYNSNIDPGENKTPLFFETPFTDGSHNVGVAVCGQVFATWGGAYVWISSDDESYQMAGQVPGPSRYGKIVGAITDTDTTVIVQLADTETQLLSASSTAADANATLMAIGIEWMAYETATLVGAGKYQLAGLRRGQYGSLATTHADDEDFLRYDTTGFLYPYQVEDIGRLIYIKLTPYNIFGLNVQPLEDAVAYQYVIRGAGAMSRIERATKSITVAGWTTFTFATPFNNIPALNLFPQTVGSTAYKRNVTVTGFEALIQKASDATDMIGTFIYEAQGW